jgi:hypothetical protein
MVLLGAELQGGKTARRSPASMPQTAPDSNGPGGSYDSTDTQTYTIACINSSTVGKPAPCNTLTVPHNVVTAPGEGKNVGGNFVDCSPVFMVATFTQSAFKNVGTNFTVSGSTCAAGTHPFAISICPTVSCPSGGQPVTPPDPGLARGTPPRRNLRCGEESPDMEGTVTMRLELF